MLSTSSWLGTTNGETSVAHSLGSSIDGEVGGVTILDDEGVADLDLTSLTAWILTPAVGPLPLRGDNSAADVRWPMYNTFCLLSSWTFFTFDCLKERMNVEGYCKIIIFSGAIHFIDIMGQLNHQFKCQWKYICK